MQTNRVKAVIIGDTRYFHIGSRVNCENLLKSIAKHFEVLGIFCGDDFVFDSDETFLKKIGDWGLLLEKIKQSEVVFFNGEGYLEKNSNHADALFLLANYIRRESPSKKIHLVNFSCFDQSYWNWNIFDTLVPRESETFRLLSPQHKNVKLGFDCSILQKDNRENSKSVEKNIILVFRGRKTFNQYELNAIRNQFPEKKVVLCSSFWKFSELGQIQPEADIDLYNLLNQAHLVISSSFHGILFSTRFNVPFIPIDTLGTDKNASVSLDILGMTLFKRRSLAEWINFYKNTENYVIVRKRLKTVLPSLQVRANTYSKI